MANRLTRARALAGGIAVPEGSIVIGGVTLGTTAAELNQLGAATAVADGLGRGRIARATYSFAVHGGAIGAITIGLNAAGAAAPVTIPAGAVIMDGLIVVDAAGAVTSAGLATVAVGVVAANDILAATAKASIVNSAKLDVIPVGTAATVVSVASGSAITITVATAALTAGKFDVFLRYFL